MNQSPRIAIVGLAGRFPGSGADLGRFWDIVRTATDCSREVPADRWLLPPEQCFDPRVANPDTVYSTRGYFLDPFEPDIDGLGLPAELIAELDPLFHLILDVGHRAWKTAQTANVDRRKAGVILGNICLPTDKASDLARDFLAPSTQKPTRPVHPWNRYVAGLPAGLLAKALGLGAGHFTLDAACASSLYAIKLACDELQSGRADVMLAGGASRPDCLYTQMGFSQLRALSASGKCSPFSANADGLVVGEGSGIFVLKRLDDAEREGDTIRAVIRGWGVSNDIGGNLLAPSSDGQVRAMRDAYRMAGWQPTDIGLMECHATGTPVGDTVEFESMRELWRTQTWKPGQCVIGSVKSTVGHLLTGAGSAALAKALLAIENRTLPPQANFHAPSGQLDYADGPFRLLNEAETWPSEGPRRAAVSGFGFGGVNAHVLIEEYVPSYADTHAPIIVGGFTQLPISASETGPGGDVSASDSIAIIGIGAHVGPWKSAHELESFLLSNSPDPVAASKRNGWDEAPATCPAGHFIESIAAPLDRFRIPPREMGDMLPQQLLMLHVAAEAIDDSGGDAESERGGELNVRTGVFIGLGLDLNTTNYHLRWATGDADLPALTADRTMGALGSIAASRIARAFHFGGSSFTCCSEETSAGTAVALAVRALRRGELDRAVVGGVDLAGDPRQLLATAAIKTIQPRGQVQPHASFETGLLPAEGAAAVVLKRLSDAERDGDRVYAVIRGVGTATGGDSAALSTDAATYASSFVRACSDAGIDPAGIDLLDGAASGTDADDRAEAEALSAVLTTIERPFPLALSASRGRVGHTGAASALVSLVQLSLALHRQILPATPACEQVSPSDGLYSSRSPRYWLADRDSPRRAALAAVGADGSCVHIMLEEATANSPAEPPKLQEGLFALDGGTPGELLDKANSLATWAKERGDEAIGELARAWWHANPPHADRKLGAALVARTPAELHEQIVYLAECIADPTARDTARELRAVLRDRVFYSPVPLGPKGKIAFVFPGSGNHFTGMGRDLGVAFPEVLRKQQTENIHLRGQYAPDKFWADFLPSDTTAKQFLFGQVALGTLVSDTLVSLGVNPDAAIGLSLGESSSLFGLRVWLDRDEMFRRIRASSLFESDLAPPYDAARKYWSLDEVDWVSGVLAASADDVRSHLRPGLRAFLLIVNTPTECVVGGLRADVSALAESLGKTFFPLGGVTLAHCEAGKQVEEAYRELHTLPAVAVPGLQVFSGAWARPYATTSANAGASITAGLLNTLDFPAVLDAAYREGVRVFIEVGPGNSCTRMIGSVLNGRAHLARAITVARQDATSNILKLLGSLVAERYPIDLGLLFGPLRPKPVTVRRTITIPVGRPSRVEDVAAPPSELITTPKPVPTPPPLEKRPPIPFVVPASLEQTPAPRWNEDAPPGWADAIAPVLAGSSSAQTAVAEAHERFLHVQHGLTQTTIAALQFQNDLIRRLLGSNGVEAIPVPVDPLAVPRSLSFEQCTEYAVGKIGRVLGSLFAEADEFPTRVRLPEGPLMLVDRVLSIEGEPKSMARGRVVTDHTVHPRRWYLDNGRCPTSITVEAGQADLFLAGFLGIDFQTKGLAVYRLLDAVVTFHRELPRVGERIEYDIRIDEFFRQADSWLFRFRFEGTIDGEPLLSMANGVAGFFTAKALAAGQGIIHTKLDRQPMPGKRPADWVDLVPFEKCSLSADQVAALHRGDLGATFGSRFLNLPLKNPMKLPAGMLRLVDRVPLLDPTGGRFGLGFVRAEYDIQPEEWFIECHFIDDKVMPGTLMYECCLHTLRILLMRMGWIGEEGAVNCEPVPGIQSRLKCRGQVLDTTRRVTYEVSVKELGFRPELYCIADALMYADGKPIVEITNLSLRMSGLSFASLKRVWGSGFGVWEESEFPSSPTPHTPNPKPAYLYASDKIMAYSNGQPSEGFGEPYRIFDRDRVIARLPGPPYQFLDGITAVTGEPFALKDGASCEALYAVPEDAWYFAANRCDRMPFSILLEIALQPCGWLAAYCGSALTSDSDLSFRNLGGQGTQFELVGPVIGTLTTRVTMTKVSNSAGMIIQHFDLLVLAGERKVYEGTTYFGFFAKAALVNQVGMVQAKVPYLTLEQAAVAEVGLLPHEPPFPTPMLRMVDRIDGYLPAGGSKSLGLVQGRIAVNPEFWFFKAHFYQDPVWPGSLGVESFLQLLKYAAWKRWGDPPAGGWQTVAPNRKHAWTYRGQVLPTDREVVVVLEVIAADDARRRLTADGYLTVDGRVIYQMTGFTLE